MNKPYRTKMEYAIYVDEAETLHLAQHIQGTKRGITPTDKGSELALDGLNDAAVFVMNILNKKQLKKSQVKGIMVRYSVFENKSVVFLYIKDEDLKLEAGDFFDENLMKGVYICYSTKKSPAFVQTGLISFTGSKDLTEKLGDKVFTFPADGFFQINIPVVEEFLKDAYKILVKLPASSRINLVDLYAGVGTIGIFVGDLFKNIVGAELFPGSKDYALKNASVNGVKNYAFLETRSEDLNLVQLISENTLLF